MAFGSLSAVSITSWRNEVVSTSFNAWFTFGLEFSRRTVVLSNDHVRGKDNESDHEQELQLHFSESELSRLPEMSGDVLQVLNTRVVVKTKALLYPCLLLSTVMRISDDNIARILSQECLC